MVCFLCILVPMAHMSRGWTNAASLKDQAQSECWQFCHFGLNLGNYHAMASGDLCEPSICGPTLDLIGSHTEC